LVEVGLALRHHTTPKELMMLIDTGLTRENVERETEKAILFAIPHGHTVFTSDRMVWVPKSQVEWIAPGAYAESAHVPGWLARKMA
jgi:hypothetical protein